MGEPEPGKVIILGGGPSGLCAGWNLAQDGYRVLLLEKEEVCGGQAITFSRDGYSYDLGPHNFHSSRRSVTRFLKTSLGPEFAKWPLRMQLYIWKRRIDYPFIGVEVLKSLPKSMLVGCGLSFLLTRLWSAVNPRHGDDGTYEKWVVNRFGRRFYDIFFGPYSAKAWGIDPIELSDIVAKKRISVRSLGELLRATFFKEEKYHPENIRIVTNYYPETGIGRVTDFLRKGLLAAGGEILTGARVTGLKVDRGSVTGLEYDREGRTESLDFNEGQGAVEVLSTIPLNEMILMMGQAVPGAVREAAAGLDFTSEVLLYLNVDREEVFNVPVLYFAQEEFPFNRIYDVGLFSRRMVPKGKTALCLELTCSQGDEIWGLDDETLFEMCIRPLEAHGLVHHNQVEAFHTRRLAHAYPRFRVGYEQKLKEIIGFVDSLANLETFGRQGLFSYANIDDALWMGFEMAKQVPYKNRLRITYQELLSDYIDF